MFNMTRLQVALVVTLMYVISLGTPAFARGGGVGGAHENPWNPEHIGGLPVEIRSALTRMCGPSAAEHPFVRYLENSQLIVLHFEHFRCGTRGSLCTAAGCLHQVYARTGAHYRLLKSYYTPEGD